MDCFQTSAFRLKFPAIEKFSNISFEVKFFIKCLQSKTLFQLHPQISLIHDKNTNLKFNRLQSQLFSCQLATSPKPCLFWIAQLTFALQLRPQHLRLSLRAGRQTIWNCSLVQSYSKLLETLESVLKLYISRAFMHHGRFILKIARLLSAWICSNITLISRVFAFKHRFWRLGPS